MQFLPLFRYFTCGTTHTNFDLSVQEAKNRSFFFILSFFSSRFQQKELQMEWAQRIKVKLENIASAPQDTLYSNMY